MKLKKAEADRIQSIFSASISFKPSRCNGHRVARCLFWLAVGLIGCALVQPAAIAAVPDRPTEACQLASPDDIRPVLTLRPLDLRHRSSTPHPGEAVCVWEAYDKGLVADAPADFKLTITAYRLGNAELAARTFQRSWPQTIVPSQVRTDDPGDEVARPDKDVVAIRHGNDVVVIDASDQQEEVERAADRVYRLEGLAFRIAGATVQGPVDPRVTQDACAPLSPQHVLGVLTLEPSSLQVDSDGRRCTMEVKDGSLDFGHWTENHGEVQIIRTDLGTNAAALTFQHDQTPFLPISPLVKTADPTDRLVANVDHPQEAWAVHGANYVEFLLTDVTPAAKAAPGWLYRVQRLALEAAGATIVPVPGLPPDPVVPGPLKKGIIADKPWIPPAHDAPAQSAFIDPVVAAIAFLANFRFLLMPMVVVGPVLLSAFLASRARRAGRPMRAHATGAVLCILLTIGNLVFGPQLATSLIYRFGAAGGATITASYGTSTQYNNHNVRGYKVLIRTADGKVIETSFEDDDFNVYPSHNATIYPGRGDAFTVRYLKHAPSYFVIVANDDSPWARMLRCDGLTRAVSDAGNKTRFAPDNAQYKADYDAALATAHAAKCDAGR